MTQITQQVNEHPAPTGFGNSNPALARFEKPESGTALIVRHDSSATCHIAGCKNFVRHIQNRFCHILFYFRFLNAVWALASDGFRIVSDTLVIPESCSS